MKQRILPLAALLLMITLLALPASSASRPTTGQSGAFEGAPGPVVPAQAQSALVSAPLTFIENVSQFDDRTRFQAHGGLETIWPAGPAFLGRSRVASGNDTLADEPGSAAITGHTRPFHSSATPSSAASGGITTRVSVASDGTQGNDISAYHSISADGRYVAFWSEASNLVPGDTNGWPDIFVHDRQTGQTSRVSVASDGTQGNGWSGYYPSISADGRYVTFYSHASNLVPGDTSNVPDVFVHNRQTGQTTRVSVASDGTQGNDGSWFPSISADGRYVAFLSRASNLVPGDINRWWYDVFVHDRQTGQTTRVSVASDGTQGNGGSRWLPPSISADGRYVAFSSDASNLVPGDTNAAPDVFVHDRQTGHTSRVSVASDGTQGNAGSVGHSISADGRYVAFASGASNLVPGDTNNYTDVFVHDRQTGQTSRVSVASDGTQGNRYSSRPSISADGRYVAFISEASNLVPGDTNAAIDIFIHDRQTGQTTRVSVASDGTQGNNHSDSPSISAVGRYVAFHSDASNLVPGDTNNAQDVFVHDRGALGAFSISGRISDANNNPIAGATVSTNTGHSATSNANGDYTITGLVTGTHTITPARAGYTFSPTSRTVTVPPSATGQDFTGSGTASGLSISHIEVTQVIQDENNYVTLITGKPTFVRVYVSCGEGCTPGSRVSGVLRGYRSGIELPESPIPPINSSIPLSNEDWREQRGNLRKSLNFTLPPSWATGTVMFVAEAADAQSNTGLLTFYETSTPHIIYVPIHYQGDEPDDSRIRSGFLWARKVFPTNRISYVPGTTLVWDISLNTLEGRVKLLNELATRYLVYGYVYGWVPHPHFVGGVASAVGGAVAFSDDDPIFWQQVFTHEVAHLMGRPHTKAGAPRSCGNPTPDLPSDWPDPNSAAIGEWGLNAPSPDWLLQSSDALLDPQETFDYMSYCWYRRHEQGPAWTSPHTYRRLFNETLGVTNAILYELEEQSYLISSGLVFTDDTANLDPFWVITAAGPVKDNPPPGTEYCLEALDASDGLLSAHCFDLDFHDHFTGEHVDVDGFSLAIPYDNNTARIILRKGTTELAVRSVSSNAPVVNVISPNGGEIWDASGNYTITWTAVDADGDALAFRVEYSPDGANWLPVGGTTTEMEISVNAAELPGSDNAIVRVFATDGVNTSVDESDDSFQVASKEPRAKILSPQPGLILPTSVPLLLQGYAYDLEDGELEGSALQWSSSLDGNLGTGSMIMTNLSTGLHEISLAATDSDGNKVTASIDIFVGNEIYLPFIRR
jgi:Tol biopolymer transport system component